MKSKIEDQTTFSVVRKIADGGMGSVYEAIQHGVEGFEKTVALKVMLEKFTENQAHVDMFIQEAKLVADLVHENIVQIYQFSKFERNFYIVMEYVNGISLIDFVRHHSRNNLLLPSELSVFICSRIARALAYAHSRLDKQGDPLKIVHRDVGLNNVLITTEGLPKLTDFGLALIQAYASDSFGERLFGKLPHMSPEQARKKEMDHRSDIFSLGTMLFECLALRRVRTSADRKEHLEQAKEGIIEWDLLPDIAADLRNILARALAKDPSSRYQSSHDLAKALELHIYKDGYGPTINTLEDYMRKVFPKLYL